jgi:uncharacterized protein (TIGR03435 family)
VDVHVSPHSSQPQFRGGVLRSDRYSLRDATMVNLVAKAYSMESPNAGPAYGNDDPRVYGGPAWVAWDRFDIFAQAPATTSRETIKLMLRTLLAERFKLVVHADTKPLPAYVLTVGPGKPKLTESDGSGEGGCADTSPKNPPAGTISYDMVSCQNMNMEAFAEMLQSIGYGYIQNPVVDSTGLKGTWDFDLKWTARGDLSKAGADGISIFDAVDKLLGLKLDLKTAPLPVIVIDSVNEKPTPNDADLDKKMPPLPPAEFEVAAINPSRGDEQPNASIDGNQIHAEGIPLNFIINYAWNTSDQMVVGEPRWVGTDRFDILAKASATALPSGVHTTAQQDLDTDDLRNMAQGMMKERFGMVSHMEDRPIDAFTLLAGNPKLVKADPANRTGCNEGPGADGKDPRIANPILGRLVTCHNITMAEFAEQLQKMAPGFIKMPVLDATGIEGRYDFTLSFSTNGQLQNGGGPTTGDAAPDPSGGISLFDAINKQMGLKLVKQKRPVPVLVIDNVNEQPTEN